MTKKTAPFVPPSSLNLTKETKRSKVGRKKTEEGTPDSGGAKGLTPDWEEGEEEGVAEDLTEDVRRGEGTLVSSKDDEQVGGAGRGV